MSTYISSLLPEPVRRRARQLQESLLDPPHASLESGPSGSRDDESIDRAASADTTTPLLPNGESDISIHREASLAALEEASRSSLPFDDNASDYPRSAVDADDTTHSSSSLSAALNATQLGDTEGPAGASTLEPFDGMRQSPGPAPPQMDTSPSAMDSNIGIGGRLQARESTGRGSGQSNPYATTDLNWEGRDRLILPEDDGMSTLRDKIHSIRDATVSNEEKARLIHGLMTEKYNSSLSKRHSQSIQPRSPGSHGQERPWTPLSQSKRSSGHFSLTPNSATSATSFGYPYYLTEDDLQPTYVPRHDSSESASENTLAFSKDIPNDDAVEEENYQLGCQHYKRRVKPQCYTCKKWYPCRFCHDKEEDHALIRRATQNMLCMVCRTPQPAAQWCKSCGVQAACYYCSICKLWDNDTQKSIYHCSDCGICRRGQGLGKDYYHCKTCSMCIPIAIQQTHRCIERSTQCDCPICGDYMFTSPDAVIFMKCGHSIHQKCFTEYSKTSYRCPICSKTISNMETHFRNLDRTIKDQPMPPDFRDTRALISCNDCSAKSAVPYHWLGLKCEVCYSYNTSQIRLLTPDENYNHRTGRHEASEPRDVHRNMSIPIRMTRLQQNSDGNRAISESAMPSVMSRSVPAHDISLSPPQTPDQTTSYRRSFSTMPLRSVPAMIGNYFGLHRRSDSSWSSGSHGEESKTANNDSDDIDFWGSKASRPTFGIFGDGEDDDDEVILEDESESTDVSEDDGAQDDTEDDDDEDDVDEIDIFGHK
ncbi:hypothetical protein AJ79_01415 [Helicocarpus griseus UAMH5409]|uniref:RING finger and CHY zinc finger domain-containing protein 1 n=1 Tax=Helicocarpus griseus UAMH5409 TaxID=1447875 RepID=A0A2B7Y7J8_9EURO|nr:hypothetical protein AJ79_01415 [Helicocarpus griseus UAMH5409]